MGETEGHAGGGLLFTLGPGKRQEETEQKLFAGTEVGGGEAGEGRRGGRLSAILALGTAESVSLSSSSILCVSLSQL